MYAAAVLPISPRESEIPLILSTKDFPLDLNEPEFRSCNLTFNLSPGLQFSNCKWLIGVKGLTIPTRFKNIDSSFKMLILSGSQLTEF